MYLRLAFAVAAHLEPEILVVDEVLAVGDSAFRKKCHEKVRGIALGGATVLVVSHNAQQVTSLCQRAIWLNGGQLVDDGPATDVVTKYLSKSIGLGGERTWTDDQGNGGDIARLRAMRVMNERGEVTNHVDVRERFCIETEIEVLKPGYGMVLKYDLQNSDNAGAFSSIDTKNPTWKHEPWDVGTHVLRMWVPGNFMQVDTYPVHAALWVWEPDRHVETEQFDAVCVHILDHLEGPTAAAGLIGGRWKGPIRPIMEWDMERKDQAGAHGAFKSRKEFR